MFAGMASAATGAYFYNGADGSSVFKGDHTYGFDVEINDLNAAITNFADVNPAETDCENSPNGTYAKNMLYVDFDYTDYDGFKLPNKYDEGCLTIEEEDFRVYPPAVDVYVTFSKDGEQVGEPHLVRVSPEVWLANAECGTVVDKVYFPIERQNLPQFSDAKIVVSDVLVKNFKLITPNNPGDYAPCVGHTVCMPVYCTNITVVDTVARIIDVQVDGCNVGEEVKYVAGNEVTVSGTVLSTEYDDTEICKLKPWDGSTCAWPVLIEIKKVMNGCDECAETVCAFGDAMNPVSVASEDNCGNLSIGSCGDQVLCAVTADIDENGNFSGRIKVPACLDGQDEDFRYVVRVSTIEVADANDDDVVDFQNDTYAELVPSESIEDLAGKTLDNPQPKSLKAADAAGVCEINDDSAEGRHHIARQVIPVCTKFGDEALEHSWVQADLIELPVVAGKPWTIGMADVGTQINFAFDAKNFSDKTECVTEVPITVCLYDQYGNLAPNYNPCTMEGKDVKVELMAVKNGVIPEQTAGKFYNKDGQEVTYVIIPAGQNCTDGVTFEPNAIGYIDLKAISIFPDGQKKTSGWCNIEVNDCVCIFEGPTILVETNECDLGGWDSCYDCDKIAAAGWPVQFSVHYDPATLRVELLEMDSNGNLVPATWNVQWNTELWEEDGGYLVFAATDAVLYPNKLSGDTYEHPDEGGVTYDGMKSDFYVYTDLSACGKTLVVKIVDVANNKTQVSEPILFGTPTDMVRVMDNGWNIISTPVTLAGDGNMKSLFMDEANPDGKLTFTDVLTYKNGVWAQTDIDDEMMPLDAYWVLMNQNYCFDCCDLGDCGQQKNVYANFVFDRVTNPMLAMQPTKDMNPGFNLIGPSFTRDEHVFNDYARFSHKWDCDYFAYDPCCDLCSCIVPTENDSRQCGLRSINGQTCGDGECQEACECGDLCKAATFQTDRLYRMLATVSKGSNMVVNPTGKGLNVKPDAETDYKYWGTGNTAGNLAPWTTAALGMDTNPSWYDDPVYRAFNGDGYWLYIADTPQTLVGAATPLLVNAK